MRFPVRVLSLLLTYWEPIAFAATAVGAVNAVAVRGVPVVLVLVARLVTTVLCVAAGRALQTERPSGVTLCRLALPMSAVVQVFAKVTPYFPSNLPPGQSLVYVGVTLTYYGAWLLYVMRLPTTTSARSTSPRAWP